MGVSQCAHCDSGFFKGQDVAVIGGGDAAMQEAIVLTETCRTVYIVVRGNLAARRTLADRAAGKSNVKFIWDTEVEAVLGKTGVTGLKVRSRKDGATSELPCDGVFPFVGVEPNNAYLPAAIKRDAKGCVITDERFHSNDPTLYAIGALRAGYGGDLISAAGEAAQVAAMISDEVYPGEAIVMYSNRRKHEDRYSIERNGHDSGFDIVPQHELPRDPSADHPSPPGGPSSDRPLRRSWASSSASPSSSKHRWRHDRSDLVAKSAPDGYTLLITSAAIMTGLPTENAFDLMRPHRWARCRRAPSCWWLIPSSASRNVLTSWLTPRPIRVGWLHRRWRSPHLGGEMLSSWPASLSQGRGTCADRHHGRPPVHDLRPCRGMPLARAAIQPRGCVLKRNNSRPTCPP
jgi:hypothetical protein